MIGYLGDVVAGLGGALVGTLPAEGLSARVLRVVTDSRVARPGDLFFAVRGGRFDGHAFVGDALSAGAVGCVVDRDVEWSKLKGIGGGGALIRVDDVVAGLGRLAAWHRERLRGKVIAVTGSNGKTTTKDMLHHVLSSRFRGSAAERSFNNSLGVPLTLLGADAGDEYVVVEIGSNAPGEVGVLGGMSAPDVAVVTSIGMAHVGGLGGIEGVAMEKFSLLGCLRAGGLGAVPADWSHRLSEFVSWIGEGVEDAAQEGRRCISFGLDERMAPWTESSAISHVGVGLGESTGRDISVMVESSGIEGVRFGWGDGVSAVLPIPGRHHAANAGAVIAVGRWMGMEDGEIAAALTTFRARDGRATVRRFGPVAVIDDSYNANPTSMAGALSVLAECGGRRVFICGDMGELGEDSERCHEELGRMARALDVALVVAVGGMSAVVGRGFGGDPVGRMVGLEGPDEACAIIGDLIESGDTVLVKGSRLMGLERVVSAIETRWSVAMRPVH